jgi:peptide/nickel transport system permease protein
MKWLGFVQRNTLLVIGLIMLMFLIFITFIGSFLPFIDQDIKEVQYIWTKDKVPLAPPFGPSELFPFGSDRQGRDILSIIVMGEKGNTTTCH